MYTGEAGLSPQAGGSTPAGRPRRARGGLYSQASLLSKLDRAMAKACSAHSG